MKMGRRPRCSSVTHRFRYAPLLAPCRRRILIATKAMLFRGQDTSRINGVLRPNTQTLWQDADGSSRIAAGDVSFEMIDCCILFGNQPFQQIPD
jgi:hypothetical protein